MNANEDCPLTQGLLQLLQRAVDLRRSDTESLAADLHRSPYTVRMEFHSICATLGVQRRTDAILFAVDKGWVHLTPRRKRSE